MGVICLYLSLFRDSDFNLLIKKPSEEKTEYSTDCTKCTLGRMSHSYVRILHARSRMEAVPFDASLSTDIRISNAHARSIAKFVATNAVRTNSRSFVCEPFGVPDCVSFQPVLIGRLLRVDRFVLEHGDRCQLPIREMATEIRQKQPSQPQKQPSQITSIDEGM
jgi:hypothetical protein